MTVVAPGAAALGGDAVPKTAVRTTGPETALELVVDEPGQHVLVRGRLDVRAAADARLALAAAVADGTGDLVLDLSGLEAVDATGLGVLVGAHRAAGRVGRRLVLLDVPTPVGRLLLVTRLSRVLRTAVSPGR
jgi:anti-anti-sigma factor